MLFQTDSMNAFPPRPNSLWQYRWIRDGDNLRRDPSDDSLLSVPPKQGLVMLFNTAFSWPFLGLHRINLFLTVYGQTFCDPYPPQRGLMSPLPPNLAPCDSPFEPRSLSSSFNSLRASVILFPRLHFESWAPLATNPAQIPNTTFSIPLFPRFTTRSLRPFASPGSRPAGFRGPGVEPFYTCPSFAFTIHLYSTT